MPLEITYRKLDELVPYARNARVHSTAQVKLIQSSLAEYGWTNPMLIADSKMIAGHGRLAAALAMRDHSIPIHDHADLRTGPTIDLSHLSITQRRAYVMMDNKSALEATWDEELQKIELEELGNEGFDLSLTGFGTDELNAMFANGDGEGGGEDGEMRGGAGSLAARFGVPPFTVLNAREGWWQSRKQAWIGLGIQSELGRGDDATPGGGPIPLDRAKDAARKANAEPGGNKRPAMDYSKGQRGDGRVRPVE